MIYLDTHIALWLYAGELTRLSVKQRAALEQDELCISPAVAFELQYLYEVGKIKTEPKHILNSLNAEIGLSMFNSSFMLVVEYAMAIDWTRDPFDRLITAQAQLDNTKLLTKDRLIKVHYASVID